MVKLTKAKRTIKKCKTCVKRKSNGTCLAFTEPIFQWNKKECYGYTGSIQDLRKIFNDIWEYSSSQNRITKYFLQEISACISYHAGGEE